MSFFLSYSFYMPLFTLNRPYFSFPQSDPHLQFLTSEIVEASAAGTGRNWAFFRPLSVLSAHWLLAPDKASSSLAKGSSGFIKDWTTGGNGCLYCLDFASDCSQIKVNWSYWTQRTPNAFSGFFRYRETGLLTKLVVITAVTLFICTTQANNSKLYLNHFYLVLGRKQIFLLFCFAQIMIVFFSQAHPRACRVTKASQTSLKSLPLQI